MDKTNKGSRKSEAGGMGNRRLLKALIVLLAASLALSAVQLALTLGKHGQADALPGPSMAQAGDAVLQGTAAEQALEAQGLVPVSADEVPAWVVDEVMDAALCAGGYANGDWSVVGIVRDGAPDGLFAELAAALGERGWTVHESGVANAAALTKEGGEATWAMLQCTAVGGSTTAVLQLSR